MTLLPSNSKGNAFIGVSLDSKLFSIDWIRLALQYILDRHDSLLFLLADDLLLYTRTARFSGLNPILDFPKAYSYANKRLHEFQTFLFSEIDRVDTKRCKIYVKQWGEFSDNIYVQILRKLQIAFTVVTPFRESVNKIARQHVDNSMKGLQIPSAFETSIAFILDEIAMCLRVTEFGEYNHEYYPSSQTDVLTKLYSGTFLPFGLSVETLIGKKPQRIFQILDNSTVTSNSS